MLFDGIHVPLATPFYRDGRLYLRKLEHNVGRLSLTPAAGLVAFFPGLEQLTLSDAERRECLEAIVATAAPEKVLTAGIWAGSVSEAVRQAEDAAKAGFDALLVGAPLGWQRVAARSAVSAALSGDLAGESDIAEVVLYLRAVADRSPLPVLLWSEAAAPSFALSIATAAGLATHPNVLGMMDADLTVERWEALRESTRAIRREVVVTPIFAAVTGRMLQGRSPSAKGPGGPALVRVEALGSGGTAVAEATPLPVLRTRTRNVSFQVMSAGLPTELVPLLAAGVPGAAPTLAACAPQGCYEVYAAYKDGDQPLASLKAERLRAAEAAMASLGVAAAKYACDLNGYFGGVPRLPALPLDEAGRRRVEQAFVEVKN